MCLPCEEGVAMQTLHGLVSDSGGEPSHSISVAGQYLYFFRHEVPCTFRTPQKKEEQGPHKGKRFLFPSCGVEIKKHTALWPLAGIL